MSEPVMGVTDVYAAITPATELARNKIMNIKLGPLARKMTKIGSSNRK